MRSLTVLLALLLCTVCVSGADDPIPELTEQLILRNVDWVYRLDKATEAVEVHRCLWQLVRAGVKAEGRTWKLVAEGASYKQWQAWRALRCWSEAWVIMADGWWRAGMGTTIPLSSRNSAQAYLDRYTELMQASYGDRCTKEIFPQRWRVSYKDYHGVTVHSGPYMSE